MMTPRQFYNCVKGYEIRQRTGWEQTRMVAFYMIKPHIKKGKVFGLKDVMQFPWEKEKQKLTKNKVAEIKEAAKMFHQNTKAKKYNFSAPSNKDLQTFESK